MVVFGVGCVGLLVGMFFNGFFEMHSRKQGVFTHLFYSGNERKCSFKWGSQILSGRGQPGQSVATRATAAPRNGLMKEETTTEESRKPLKSFSTPSITPNGLSRVKRSDS
jgi:hypothetical protein